MKSNKGISLISLIITIVVMLILSGIVIFNTWDNQVNKATFTKVYNEMQEVTTAVQQRHAAHRIDSVVYPYVGTPYTDAAPIEIKGIKYGDGYYLVTANDLSTLGIRSAMRDYIVNYNTGEVISKEPIYLEEQIVYTIDELLQAEMDTHVATSKGEYDSEKGVNKPILSSGMIPVKYEYASWTVTSEDDPEWYDYSADADKWANVMLLDELELVGMTNEEVRQSTIDQIVGMEVAKEGSAFVWIPRYTYKEIDGKYDIVYSKLTIDYVSDGYIKNPAFYLGEYNGADTDTTPNSGYKGGGKELTGIWISKYEAGYAE